MSITEHELPGVVTFPEEWVPAPVQDPESEPPQPSQAEKVAELLRRSADLLEKHGWTTGGWRTADGRMCALGAMERATAELYPQDLELFGEVFNRPLYMNLSNHPVFSDALGALGQSISRKFGYEINDSFTERIYHWNDSMTWRAKHRVIRQMRKVAQEILASS